MKFFLVLFGLLLFATVEAQATDFFVLPSGTGGRDRVVFSRIHSRAASQKVKNAMKQTRLVPVSKWGGNGIRMSVEAKTVKIEYGCAEGEITGRLKTDGRGTFKATGFHIMQRPGPVRMNDTPQRQPAQYEGKIQGKTMTLSVTLTETKENIGNFELKQNAATRLMRCL